MLAILDDLIRNFRNSQDYAVHKLTHELSIPLPKSNRAWLFYCLQNGLHDAQELNGIGIYAHGYGIELKIDGLTIDFDWGDTGDPDGFDGWRLWNFQTENHTEVEFSHSDVNDWLKTAFSNGELIKDTSLYFDPKRRAK